MRLSTVFKHELWYYYLLSNETFFLKFWEIFLLLVRFKWKFLCILQIKIKWRHKTTSPTKAWHNLSMRQKTLQKLTFTNYKAIYTCESSSFMKKKVMKFNRCNSPNVYQTVDLKALMSKKFLLYFLYHAILEHLSYNYGSLPLNKTLTTARSISVFSFSEINSSWREQMFVSFLFRFHFNHKK